MKETTKVEETTKNVANTRPNTLVIMTRESAPLIADATKLVISNPKELNYSAELSAKLKFALKMVKEDREKITAPMVEALEAVRDKYRPTENTLKMAIDTVTKSQSLYQTEQLRIQKMEEQKIADKIKPGSGNLSLETGLKRMAEIEKTASVMSTSIGKMTFRTDQKLKVLDLTKIPLEYFDLNEMKLKLALKNGAIVAGAILEEVQIPVNSQSIGKIYETVHPLA